MPHACTIAFLLAEMEAAYIKSVCACVLPLAPTISASRGSPTFGPFSGDGVPVALPAGACVRS